MKEFANKRQENTTKWMKVMKIRIKDETTVKNNDLAQKIGFDDKKI